MTTANSYIPTTSNINNDKERRKQVIFSLNQNPMSTVQIAKKLGISQNTVLKDLKDLKAAGFPVIDYNVIRNQQGKWYNIIKYIKDELLPHYSTRGIIPSLRTIFYRLEVDGLLEKKDTQYNKLVHETKEARLGEINQATGLVRYPKLPIACFADEVREFIDNYKDEIYSPEDPTDAEDPEEYIKRSIKRLKDAPYDWDYEGDRGQIGGYWYNQPEYVEVWLEKNALAPTFQSFLEDRHVVIVINRGYSSLTFLYHNCQRLKKKIEEFGEGHVHVSYFGDLDPSGDNMDDVIKDYFRMFGIPTRVFKRVSLTPEQTDEFNIPTKPVKANDGSGKFEKGDNPNANRFIRKHGDKAAELDAFLAVDEDAFEELVQWSVDQYYDESIYDEMVEEFDRDPDFCFTEEERELNIVKMIETITDSFKPGWDKEYYEDASGDENE